MSGEEGHAASVPFRPLRADAARNRARIIEAARRAFAEVGLDVGVEEIARRAGVGKGTLYRRFPTKDALVRAIFEDRLNELERLSTAAARAADPWDGFVRFLELAARLQASDQGFLDVVAQNMGPGVLSPEHRRRFLGLVGAPVRRAQEAGLLRADVVPEDVPFLLRMLGATTRPAPDGQSMEGRWPRYLGVLLDGLRAEGATPLAAEPWRPR